MTIFDKLNKLDEIFFIEKITEEDKREGRLLIQSIKESIKDFSSMLTKEH